MNVMYRGVRQSLSLRGLLFLVGLALVLIAGLLGMHSLSGDVGGHGTPAAAHPAAVAVAGADSAMVADHESMSSECAGLCMTGSSGGHMSMGAACVLALLSGFFLLLPPIVLNEISLRRLLQVPVWPSRSALRPPSPPSLLFLSISRT